MRILLIEDENKIADFVERGLSAEGYAVTVADDGLKGEAEALTGEFDLILLDVLLPGKNGFEVLGEIRKLAIATPVIMLTALGETEDKVRGLEGGAIDYVSKPFSFEELLARIRAQLRRPDAVSADRIEVGDLLLDLKTRRVTKGERDVELTSREFELLAYLMRHPDQVLSRTQLLNGVWGYDYDPGTNVLEVYVGYLRKKLADEGEEGPIDTVRGAGYRLRADDA
ncbi:MAG: response regulator transcription factor [bacterium]